MNHKTQINETNHMRKLMGLPLITEQAMPGSDGFEEAVKFGRAIEEWWSDKDQAIKNRDKYFAGFQHWLDDDETGAMESYKRYLSPKLQKLKDVIGEDNEYYKQLDDWVTKIYDEMDDWWITGGEHNVRLDLVDSDGNLEFFDVLPEMD